VSEGGIGKFGAVSGQIAFELDGRPKGSLWTCRSKKMVLSSQSGPSARKQTTLAAARSSVRSVLPAGRFQIMRQVDNSDVKAAQVYGLDLQPGHLD
jgi:hypothetical protein